MDEGKSPLEIFPIMENQIEKKMENDMETRGLGFRVLGFRSRVSGDYFLYSKLQTCIDPQQDGDSKLQGLIK